MAFDTKHYMAVLLASAQGKATETELLEASNLIDDVCEFDIVLLMSQIDRELGEWKPRPPLKTKARRSQSS
jgi:hypothetical protein